MVKEAPQRNATLLGSWRNVAAASWVVCLLGLGGCQERKLDPIRPNIVLITIDTLRADHLGCYGYERNTSPQIDRLASSGLVFEHAIAQAPWTLPSMASIMTSLYPREHGALHSETSLSEDLTTLAERLQESGYHTVGVATHWFVSRQHGLHQGFDIFDESLILGHDSVTSDRITAKALEHLAGAGKEPFFLWVHYFDPHFTYVRHAEYGFVADTAGTNPAKYTFNELYKGARDLREQGTPLPFPVESVKATYDEEIAFTDVAIGRLVAELELIPSDRPSVTLLTSDHGEYFMERGRFGHGREVYEELVHVPLVIWGDIDPKLRGKRVQRPVEIASVARTLAQVAGAASSFRGENLLEVSEAVKRSSDPVFSEGSHATGEDDRKVVVYSGGWKLIHDIDQDRFELFRLDRDPDERVNLWHSDTVRNEAPIEELKMHLRQFTLRHLVAGSPKLDMSPEVRENLEKLGYVEERGTK